MLRPTSGGSPRSRPCATIEEELGPIDLVANAGGSFAKPGPIEETNEEGWHASVDGNLTATFLTIKSILPGMKQRKAGDVITVSSAAGRRPHPKRPPRIPPPRRPDSGRRRPSGSLQHQGELHCP